ncbi:30S ribosomal protein S8 [Candidatus Microgenomates bacterium]|nr:30S ribosomal protein S8 [Candidatus Microgenomates bacterium]
MVNAPINDFFTRVRNAALAKKREVVLPYSHIRGEIAKVLLKGGYLDDVRQENAQLILSLAFIKKRPRIIGIKNISRPGLREYRKAKGFATQKFGMVIVSTPKGIMSGEEAYEAGVGGEVLAEVW